MTAGETMNLLLAATKDDRPRPAELLEQHGIDPVAYVAWCDRFGEHAAAMGSDAPTILSSGFTAALGFLALREEEQG